MDAKFVTVVVILGSSLLSASAELEQPIRGASRSLQQLLRGEWNVNYGQSSGEAMGVWTWSVKPPGASTSTAKQMVPSAKQGSTGGRKLQQGLTGGNVQAEYGFSTGQLLRTHEWSVGPSGATYKVAPMVKPPSSSSGRKLKQIPGDLTINYGFNSGELLKSWTYTLDRTGSTYTSQQMVKSTPQGARGSIGGK